MDPRIARDNIFAGVWIFWSLITILVGIIIQIRFDQTQTSILSVGLILLGLHFFLEVLDYENQIKFSACSVAVMVMLLFTDPRASLVGQITESMVILYALWRIFYAAQNLWLWRQPGE